MGVRRPLVSGSGSDPAATAFSTGIRCPAPHAGTLDNRSSHTSKETQRHLATRPNRFEFVFTPKHGSWLNLIEVFFGKMPRSFLRGLRVGSKDELRARIDQYLEKVNLEPVVFPWNYQLEETPV